MFVPIKSSGFDVTSEVLKTRNPKIEFFQLYIAVFCQGVCNGEARMRRAGVSRFRISQPTRLLYALTYTKISPMQRWNSCREAPRTRARPLVHVHFCAGFCRKTGSHALFYDLRRASKLIRAFPTARTTLHAPLPEMKYVPRLQTWGYCVVKLPSLISLRAAAGEAFHNVQMRKLRD